MGHPGGRMVVIRGEELRTLRMVDRSYRMRQRIARVWHGAGGWWTLASVVSFGLAVVTGWVLA